jgi:hypothetical protein
VHIRALRENCRACIYPAVEAERFVCFIAAFIIARESLHCIAFAGVDGGGGARTPATTTRRSRRKQKKNAKELTKTFNSQGYDANHPDIDLMRLRNYTIGASLSEGELLDGGLERVSELLGSLKPFVSWRTFSSSATTLPVPHRRPYRTTEGTLA